MFSMVLFLVVLFHLQYKVLHIWAEGKQEKVLNIGRNTLHLRAVLMRWCPRGPAWTIDSSQKLYMY